MYVYFSYLEMDFFLLVNFIYEVQSLHIINFFFDIKVFFKKIDFLEF